MVHSVYGPILPSIICMCVLYCIFENHTLKALNISFKKVVLPGRVKCGGTEEEIVVAHGCRKRKKLICGPEDKIVMAHGRLPSPARYASYFLQGVLC